MDKDIKTEFINNITNVMNRCKIIEETYSITSHDKVKECPTDREYIVQELEKMLITNNCSGFNYNSVKECPYECKRCNSKFELTDFYRHSLNYCNGNEYGLAIRFCGNCGYFAYYNYSDC